VLDDLDFRGARASEELRRAAVQISVRSELPADAAITGARTRKLRVRTASVGVILLVVAVGVAQWAGRDAKPTEIVAAQPEDAPSNSDGPTSENATPPMPSPDECFEATELPENWSAKPSPGPAVPGGPLDGPKRNVMHWGHGDASFIDVASSDEPYPLGTTYDRFMVLGMEALASTVGFSTGESAHLVTFPACGEFWVLSAFRMSADDLRRFAQGLTAQ
jgi:hypothetical protein